MKKENEAIEANQQMDEIFNDNDSRHFRGDSEVETANHQINEQFYENKKEINSLPFQIESNIPPIKK
ncbi:hypothetical protein [Neobacillus mesonae]|uniref:Uncharacterized protein n=1 Tax=Neobacillus mesonae TaxID=1193713 RepID=A0A3Q9QSL8_9BACI|nr:hypothetical protein [Neobacillus mesonae]AZU62307.1 hypothetical protein CHR53_13995 [Neobacillus mesonae]MED4205456.1 hypothetical protein [Neobacillus mesonae]